MDIRARGDARTRSRAAAKRLRIAVSGLGFVAATVALSAHEEHATATVKPTYQTIEAGDAKYRVGFAMQPQDALVGDQVRLELHVVRLPDGAVNGSAGTPVSSAPVQLQVVSAASPPHAVTDIAAGEKPGTYLARHRFTDRGQYGIAIRLDAEGRAIAAEFPIVIGAGPIPRATLIGDAIVVIVIGALVFGRWRRARATDGARGLGASEAAWGGVGLVVLAVGHLWISPAIGRMLLPERHTGAVPWDTGAAVENTTVAPHEHPPGTLPHSHDDAATAPPDNASATLPNRVASAPAMSVASLGAHEIVSTVVPIPGRMVEVVVPMSARLLFDGFTPRVGRLVTAGQTLATLEQHYILHDAVHLINQRWLYMVPMLTTKRQRLLAELNLLRLQHLQRSGDEAVKQMMEVTQAVRTAELALATATLEEARAAKLLEMHDAQISEEALVTRPLKSPITGTIEAVNFTQGQLKYEGDKLITVLDLSRVWVEARFPGDAVGQPPRRMTFASSAFPTMRFEGERVRVADTLDPASGTLSAFYEVSNRDRLLRVGMPLSAASASDGATAAVGRVSDVVSRAVADPDLDEPTVLTGVVKADPEHTAEVTAPLWGRIEFAGRHLAVGDRVRKGENLLNVVLELSVDERYPMNARGVEIAAELDMAKARRAQAEEQRKNAIEKLKASPKDAFVQEEAQIVDQILRDAREEEELLTRQAGAYQGTIKRRDPKTTPVQTPISGVITEIGFRPGELNRTGEFRKLLTIVDTSRVWLEAPVYESQSAALLRDYKSASFTSPAVPTSRPLDRPVAVSGMVSPTMGTLAATFAVPNPDGALKIGATVRIVVNRQ